MNCKIRTILTMAAFLGAFSVANAQQDNFHSVSADGKEKINTNWRNHWYMITLVDNKATALCVDNKKIADTDLPKYDSLITRIVTRVRLDEAQADRDRAQADRDREQADHDRTQADHDREQANRDREQADRDRIQAHNDQQQAQHDQQQAEQDRHQADRDREQARRDQEQAEHDREQAVRDRAQAEIDRKQAAEDRENMRQLIHLLVEKKIIPDAAGLKSLVLTDDELLINGTKASPALHAEIKEKYSKWAHSGFSYGVGYGSCCSVHMHMGHVSVD